jgi:hypothetical protein
MTALIEDYVSWTAKVWSGRSPHALGPKDFSIMGMGLPGENGEVIEVLLPVLEGAGPLDHKNLLKELGDTIYYWARTCNAFDVPLGQVWPQGPRLQDSASPGTAILLLRMACACAKVAEHLKKQVRDGECKRETLVVALAMTAQAWVDLCKDQALCVREVLATNQEKIEGRLQRGTLHGSGDDR